MKNPTTVLGHNLWDYPPLHWLKGIQGGVLTAISTIFGLVATSFIVPYFGRVVRYTTAKPDNIAARKNIRERGLALVRLGRFRGRGLFEAALAAPLVLPEVITGLSLLLLFVTLQELTGWPSGRGAGTVTIAHASVSVAYVAVVVRARLVDAGVELEQAAMDLYAPPWKAFAVITLPLMTPALVAGWLSARRAAARVTLRSSSRTSSATSRLRSRRRRLSIVWIIRHPVYQFDKKFRRTEPFIPQEHDPEKANRYPGWPPVFGKDHAPTVR